MKLKLRKNGKIVLFCVILLTIIGIYEVYSASNVVALDDYNDPFYYFKRQLLFMVVGIIIMFVIINIDINKIKSFSSFVFLFCLFLIQVHVEVH